MKLFRIQSIRKESLWYSFDGKFKDKLKDITGQEVPMPWEAFRQENNKLKLLSSVGGMLECFQIGLQRNK